MSYSIHPEAEAELGDAAVYYAKHASSFVAAAFLAEYERVRDLHQRHAANAAEFGVNGAEELVAPRLLTRTRR